MPLENLERHLAPERLRPYRSAAGGALPRAVRLYELEPQRRDDAVRARQHVRRHPVTHGRVLAELSFGFWRYLLSRRYEATLWTPALRHGFPHLRPAGRDRIYRPVDHLYTLRNRIAHHEPIHQIDLPGYERDAVFVVGSMDPGLADWLRSTGRLTEILAQRPMP